jgi:hypothetical protein
MSKILKGLLQPRIQQVLADFGSGAYSGPDDPATAQRKLADELSKAIAQAVQIYLRDSVTTQPFVTDPANGPVSHPHPIKPIKFIVP